MSLRIEGSGKLHDMEEDHHLNNELQNLKKSGNETPRQKLLRRQLRLKKGWQDGDVVGSFMLPDMKLNTRGDYVRECRIVDSSADIVGTIVVTLVFLEGSLDDFHHLKISNDEETSPNDKSNETKPKSRPSGIPVRDAHTSKIPKNVNEGYRPRSRSSSFRSSPRPKSDPLKSPRKQPGEHLFQGYQGKENEAPPRMREAKGSQPVESQEPQVVLRRGRGENQSLIRERPASWGLYPLLNGADPCSLVGTFLSFMRVVPFFPGGVVYCVPSVFFLSFTAISYLCGFSSQLLHHHSRGETGLNTCTSPQRFHLLGLPDVHTLLEIAFFIQFSQFYFSRSNI